MYSFFLANYLIVVYDSLHASDMCFLRARSSQRSDNRTYSSTSHGQSGGSNRYDNYNQGEGDSSYFRHYWECLCSLNNNLSSQNIILLFIFSICLFGRCARFNYYLPTVLCGFFFLSNTQQILMELQHICCFKCINHFYVSM